MRATGLPAPRRLRLEHAWVQAHLGFIEIVKGLGANNVLTETFWAKLFFFGTTFCIWGWVLGRVMGLGWPGLGWGLGGAGQGWW